MIEKNDYELYFLNNLYDDEIINEFISSFNNRLYYNILDGKKNIQQNIIKTGEMNQFEINSELNTKYSMPKDTYSIELEESIVPYYSEKKFLDKFGYNVPISSLDMLDDYEVFSKAYYLFIGDCYVYEYKVVVKHQGCIIFLPISSQLPKSEIDKIVQAQDARWTVITKSKSDYYYVYMSRAMLFTDNRIYVSKMNFKSIGVNKRKSNHWTMYITTNGSATNLMACTNVTYNSGGYFEVPAEFKSYVYPLSGNMRCFIVNEPECSGTGIYLNTNNEDPIFQIPFQKNPIPIDNIVVWKYDNVNKRKLYPIPNNIKLSYPNIYDFTEMITDYDIYIEWLEPMNDVSAYDTYIQEYIDCYGDQYSTMIETNTANPLIQDYNPISDFELTSDDYFASEYYGDNRAWRLSKLIQLLKDNPNRYDEFIHRLYYNIKEYVNVTYTYETYPHIYERSIMNNEAHCNDADELNMHFSEPHTFIKVYNSSCEKRPCFLFINGVKKNITYVMPFGSDMYIYFPCRYIENHEVIQLDIGLDDGQFPETISFVLSFIGAFYRLEENHKLKSNAISDFIYYDANTKKYIDLNQISYRLRVKTATIQYIGIDLVDSISMVDDQKKLYDNASLLVEPTNYDYILLSAASTTIDIPSTNSTKKLDLDSLQVTINDPDYVNDNIKVNITTTNFYMLRTFTVTQETGSFEITDFKGFPTKDRFKLYVDGRLQNPIVYDITFPTEFGGTVTITNQGLDNGFLEIHYIGYDDMLIYNNTIGSLKRDDSDILYLSDEVDLPFDTEIFRIYVDGYRIATDHIKYISQQNMITINDPNHEFTDDSNIMIFMQRVDADPYEYDTGLQFLNQVSTVDETFRNYLLDKYD